MSLATRCSSCGTIFRVVQDQLKVCEGWVRCGRCDQVFSALEGLFDLDRDPPPDWSPEVAVRSAMPGIDAASAPIERAEARGADESGSAPRESAGAASVGSMAPVENEVLALPADWQAVARVPDFQPEGPDLVAAWIDDDFRTTLNVVNGSEVARPADEGTAPEFVRHAEQLAKWKHPRTRGALLGAALALFVILALQGGHHFRDVLAARWPVTRPALSMWCVAVDCTVGAARRIDDIYVESSALNRAGAPNTFRLSVAIRNRGDLLLAIPTVELSLTDASGQLLVRRALAPGDFQATPSALQPGAESGLQLMLAASSMPVTGYTLELFYP